MQIKLLQMSLRNFKKVKALDIDFGDITIISGDNATGKTTVFDAFTWLLFGKNSNNAKDFNIKTLDANNNPIHRLEHEVSALLDVDGRHISLKKIFKEKWVKKRGSETAEMTGHETEHFVDDVPLALGEYKSRVDFIIKEEIAKLITNPLFFNQMNWTERRSVLESMAGVISNDLILDSISTTQNKGTIANLTNILNSGKNLVDFKKEIAVKKKRIKEQLESIPTRIDETNRMMPEVVDYAAIEKKILDKNNEIADIEILIEDSTKAHKAELDRINNLNTELNNLKIKLSEARTNRTSVGRNKISVLENEIRAIEIKSQANMLPAVESEIKKHKAKISELTTANNELRKQWDEENAKNVVIDDHKLNCPTCKQALPEAQRNNTVETLTKNFNENKQRVLTRINEVGQENKKEIERLTGLVAQKEESLVALKDLIAQDERRLVELRDKIEIEKSTPDAPTAEELKLQKQIDDFVIPELTIDNSELKNNRAVIKAEIDSLKNMLTGKEQTSKLNARIAELEAEEKTLSQELADLERTEFAIEAYNKAKVDTIEQRINNKFSLVKFKMFNTQINGGIEECCECMVDGVPYTDVNTAGKINAGIDIINALCKHYSINAPVWIDNRESIIRILPCDSQIINLKAVKDAKLTVTKQEPELVEVN